MKKFDVIVIGAGHAGLEAAFAAANLGKKTALITLNMEHIGDTPCNPSVGGPAKGVVTREIDALGGMQGIAADKAQLQMKLLNAAKGAGVWALRAQIDKVKYHDFWVKSIKAQKNLTLIIDEAKELIIKNKVLVGVKCSKESYQCKAMVLTTGTYLKPICHRGEEQLHEGPSGQQGANYLSDSLVANGIQLIRLKTGTPPRILKSSIDFSKMQVEPGTNDLLSFEHYQPTFMPFDMQTNCHLTYTNETTHKIIRDNISKSAMFSGRIHSIGPRYCPSIEDKVMRFADKERHQVFVEPESASWDSMYLQGLSTSFDRATQEKIVHSVAGLEKAIFLKYAYAIEYDAIDPTQLKLNYELKKIKNLFCAGQINGTSGYEEAAGQGLLAGINAVLNIKKQQPLILKRSEAYLGVLTDDIMTKGITEPYRLLTSRAEHRLYLRNDNAQERLIEYGKKVGLVKKPVYQAYKKNMQLFNKQIKYLKTHKVHQFKSILKQYQCGGYTLYQLIKRPEVKSLDIMAQCKVKNLNPDICKKIDIAIKFEGYISNQLKNIKKLSNLAKCSLSSIKNYKEVPNLTLEAIDKLNKIMPLDLEQASRISGINLVDIAIIKNYITNKSKKHD
ncbi:MAG: tRNA uridine-5-carboxymethylaminomethyl(34) synthesis enzyme MnmG [Mycoplasmoidaceae bacterium]